jgi:hypothetical protein
LERYDRELRRPFPSGPQLAADSKVWRREHGTVEDTKPLARDKAVPQIPAAASLKF